MAYETRVCWCDIGKHDKVWGMVRLTEHDWLTFWGRRGAKLQTKMIRASWYGADTLFDKKLDNGYREIPSDELDTIYPEFQSDLEKTAIWAALKL